MDEMIYFVKWEQRIRIKDKFPYSDRQDSPPARTLVGLAKAATFDLKPLRRSEDDDHDMYILLFILANFDLFVCFDKFA